VIIFKGYTSVNVNFCGVNTMGYCIELREENFKVTVAKSLEAFPIVMKSIINERNTSTMSFSWVDDEDIEKAKSLTDLMTSFRWEPDIDSEGNIISIDFCGEKLGDDKILFDIIAPFVEDDSYIEMSGEDGSIWRWIFKDGECTEKDATIVF
jgi:hypothetical protein